MRAGFRFIVSRSAVTTASVDMAASAGVTLVGFARDRERRFTVFTDAAARVLD
jgi:FdhD protein